MTTKRIMKMAKQNGWTVTRRNGFYKLSWNKKSVEIKAENDSYLVNIIGELAERYAYTGIGDALSELYFNAIEAMS